MSEGSDRPVSLAVGRDGIDHAIDPFAVGVPQAHADVTAIHRPGLGHRRDIVTPILLRRDARGDGRMQIRQEARPVIR